MGEKVRKRLRISIRGYGGVHELFLDETKNPKNISIKGSTRVAPSYNRNSRFELSD